MLRCTIFLWLIFFTQCRRPDAVYLSQKEEREVVIAPEPPKVPEKPPVPDPPKNTAPPVAPAPIIVPPEPEEDPADYCGCDSENVSHQSLHTKAVIFYRESNYLKRKSYTIVYKTKRGALEQSTFVCHKNPADFMGEALYQQLENNRLSIENGMATFPFGIVCWVDLQFITTEGCDFSTIIKIKKFTLKKAIQDFDYRARDFDDYFK